MYKTQTGNRVKSLRTDNGTEFVNLDMEKLLSKLGIIHETTIPYTPEENGSVERDNRTLVEIARTMLHASPLPVTMLNMAMYLHNRIPNRKEKTSPHETFTGQKPRVDHLKIIGFTAFTMTPKAMRSKWEGVTGRNPSGIWGFS